MRDSRTPPSRSEIAAKRCSSKALREQSRKLSLRKHRDLSPCVTALALDRLAGADAFRQPSVHCSLICHGFHHGQEAQQARKGFAKAVNSGLEENRFRGP